jgi:CheY-like chemotaxis protein
VPIIAMTASDDAAKKDEAFGVGMNDYITKPVKLEVNKQMLMKWFSEAI